MRLLSAILLLPGPAIVYIPALIFWLSLETRWAPSFPPSNLVFMVVGIFLAGIGIILAIITVRLFKLKGGDGTPAPWDPINNFVVEGPYRYVRNPMLIGVILILSGISLLTESWLIFFWMLLFFVGYNVYTILKEEPELVDRFGSPYLKYKTEVPRWLPRITPYQL